MTKLTDPNNYTSYAYTFVDALIVGAGGSANSSGSGGAGGFYRKRFSFQGSNKINVTVGAAVGGRGGDSNIRWGMFSGYTANGGAYANYPTTGWQATAADGGSGASGCCLLYTSDAADE